ncbi:MAG: hypothetical protein OHK0039_27900 [Bacteroidia bacterium]
MLEAHMGAVLVDALAPLDFVLHIVQPDATVVPPDDELFLLVGGASDTEALCTQAAAWRSQSPQVPVLFLSPAYDERFHTFEGQAQGPVDWLGWPCTPMLLRTRVLSLLALAASRLVLISPQEAYRDVRYRFLFTHIKDLICLHAPEGRYLDVSPSSIGLLGYEPAELLGKDPYLFFHPDDIARIRQESHEQILQGRRYTRIQYRIRHRDGSYRWFDTITEPLLDDRGEVFRLMTSSRDISEHVETQQLASQVMDMVPSLIYLYDLAGQRNAYANRSIGQMLGYDAHEIQVMGETVFQQVIHPDDLAHVVETQQRFAHLRPGETLDIMYRVLHKDGSTRWLRSRDTVFRRDEAGNPLQILGIAEDITAQVEADQLLRQQQQDLAEAHTRLTLAMKSALMGVFDWDVVQNKLIWDDMMYTVFDVDRGAFAGAYEAWLSTLHPDDIAHAQREVDAVLHSEKELDMSFRIIHRDGSVHHIRGLAQVFRRADGTPYRVVGINMDVTRFMETEQRLRDREFFLTQAQQIAQLGVWVVDPATGEFAESSPEAHQIYGVPPGGTFDLAHMNRVFHPDDRRDFEHNVRSINSGHPEPFTHKHRILVGDEERWLYVQGRPEYDAQGKYRRYVGITLDITRDERQKLQLAEQAAILREAQRTAKLGNWIWDIRQGTVWWSEEMFRIFGWESETPLVNAADFFNFVHPEDQEPLRQAYEHTLSDPHSDAGTEYRIVTKQGEVKHVFSRSIELEGDRLFGILQDITEQKQAEAALRASEREYRRLFETMAQGVVYQDATGQIIKANPAASEILGLSLGQLLGHDSIDPHWRAIREDGSDFPGEEHPAMEALRTGQPVINTTMGVFHPAQNAWVWILVSAEPEFRPGDDQPFQVFATFTDITELKRVEEELRQHRNHLEDLVAARTQALNEANERLLLELEEHKRTAAQLQRTNEELEQFTYSVSHDLRAPVRHIEGYAQVIMDEAGTRLDEHSRDYLAKVIYAAKRLGGMTDDLLQYSRTRTVKPVLVQVDLDHLVADLCDGFAREHPGRSIAWHIAPLPRVWADEKMIAQVFENLLSNAVKYTTRKPVAEIRVWAEPGEHETVFVVQDNGAGFDMRFAAKLFAVFQRLHTRSEFPGHGIGLANVQRIIHLHGGRIWGEGVVEQGATFRFSLPNQPQI